MINVLQGCISKLSLHSVFEYIYDDEKEMIYVYHYAYFRHIDSDSQGVN